MYMFLLLQRNWRINTRWIHGLLEITNWTQLCKMMFVLANIAILYNTISCLIFSQAGWRMFLCFSLHVYKYTAVLYVIRFSIETYFIWLYIPNLILEWCQCISLVALWWNKHLCLSNRHNTSYELSLPMLAS